LGKNALSSRRNLIKLGLLSLGTLALTGVPQVSRFYPISRAKQLTFNADDIGILNFALLLEELEAAFYPAAIKSGKITNIRELDYLRAFGNHEATHVKFLRSVLGKNTLFQTSDLSLNRSGLSALLTDRAKILNTAVTLEDLGIYAYNGAGPSLKNPTLLLVSIVLAPAAPAAESATLSPRQVVEYALTLEKLEADFYRRAIAATKGGTLSQVPQIAKTVLVSYGQDEAQHVTDLSAVLGSLGGNPAGIVIPTNPNYRVILGHDPFANPVDLLMAGQYVEDLGVAAYKGQVQNLLADGEAGKTV
jgi:Ferritin-like domain